MEVHDDPLNAPSDGPNMIRLKDLQGILETLLEYATLTKQAEQGSILGSHSPFYMNTSSNHIDEYRRQKYRRTAENLEPLDKYTIEEYKFDPPESFTPGENESFTKDVRDEFNEKMKRYVGST